MKLPVPGPSQNLSQWLPNWAPAAVLTSALQDLAEALPFPGASGPVLPGPSPPISCTAPSPILPLFLLLLQMTHCAHCCAPIPRSTQTRPGQRRPQRRALHTAQRPWQCVHSPASALWPPPHASVRHTLVTSLQLAFVSRSPPPPDPAQGQPCLSCSPSIPNLPMGRVLKSLQNPNQSQHRPGVCVSLPAWARELGPGWLRVSLLKQ